MQHNGCGQLHQHSKSPMRQLRCRQREKIDHDRRSGKSDTHLTGPDLEDAATKQGQRWRKCGNFPERLEEVPTKEAI